MEDALKTIGIDVELLNSKSLFNRKETERILSCTHQTLKSFEKRNWIVPKRFKNKHYYTQNSILKCIDIQVPITTKNTYQIQEWDRYVQEMWE
jgi:hypothetical protein